MRRSEVGARAVDPRPARTREAIYRAVARLSESESEDISVAAIARHAGVSRPAFYAQFSGLDELTVVMLSESLQEMRGTGPVASVRATIGRLVAHIDARRSFYRASLDWPVSGRAHEAVVDALAEQLLPAIPRSSESSERGVQELAHFLAGGTISVLTSWLRQEKPSSPDVVTERLGALLPYWVLDSIEHEDGSVAARR